MADRIDAVVAIRNTFLRDKAGTGAAGLGGSTLVATLVPFRRLGPSGVEAS
jgi:hypothetical protein